MKKYIKVILSFGLLYIYSCASIEAPSGGPKDSLPPELIKISPQNSNININNKETIILVFDEMIDPSTIYHSIEVLPHVDIKSKVINNQILVTPNDLWPDGAFQILISRSISDYNSNTLNKQIRLLFSTDSSLVYSKVSGKLYNIKDQLNYEVALIDSDLNIINKVEADLDGQFEIINFRNSDNHMLVALENKFSNNIIKDIKNFRYGLSNSVKSLNQQIYISNPIWNSKVINFTSINNNFGKIIFNDNNILYYLANYDRLKEEALLNDQFIYIESSLEDNMKIKFELENSIEIFNVEYEINNYINIIDSLNPFIESTNYLDNGLIINFSEPIMIKENSHPFYRDDKFNIINYEYDSPMSIKLENIQGGILNINCLDIMDLNNLVLCDSTITIGEDDFLLKSPINDQGRGSLEIDISNTQYNSLVIALENIETNAIYLYEINNNNILIEDMMPGDYSIWLYDNKNTMNLNYFSGMLEPLSLSAEFYIYPKLATVRKNWVNNILIDFNLSNEK